MKLSRIYMPLVCLLASLGQSCSDELDMPRPWEDDSVVSLRIPSPQGAFRYGQTRADGEGPDADRAAAILKEAYINDVTLYAFNADPDDKTAETKKFVLTGPTGSNPSTATDYLTYELQLKPGSYRFYMLVNAADYITTLPGENEDAVKKLALSFADNKPTTSDQENLPKGLPMGCLPTDFVGAGTDGVISTKDVAGRTLYAEPVFLCSKVRTTLLFDNTEETGFSYPGFEKAMLDLSGMSVSGSPANTAFYPEENKDLALGTLTAFTYIPAKCEWPADADSYPQLSDGSSADDLKAITGDFTDDDHQRAWQTTSYLPENLTATKTLLTFSGSQSNVPAKYPLAVPLTGNGLKRSVFYDIVGRIKSAGAEDIEFKTEVMPWELKTLTYELHGRFVLEVDKTSMEIIAGEENVLWVHSDTQVRIDEENSPKITIDGREIPVYQSTVYRNDSLFVVLNPEIPADAKSELLKEGTDEPKDKYNHFYIAAGNLLKKINVTRLNADSYLNVNPTSVLIDLREYISSGVDGKSLPIEFSTNLPNLDVSVSIAEGEGSVPIPLTEGSYDGNSYKRWLIESGIMDISMGNTEENATDGTYYLRFDKISSGGEFWSKEQTITMRFTARGDNQESIYKDLTIRVLPMSSAYTIYFKAPDSWTTPHIYAYQTLEFPSDLNNAKYAGQACGFYDNTNLNAALEYLFTNDMAFKGWNGYGGDAANKTPDDADHGWSENKDKGMYTNNSYWLFNGTLNESHYQWVDFNSDIKDNDLKCSECKGQGYRKHQWAGIEMTPAPEIGEQWYKYTLSGLATPGKCLILFAQGHRGGEQIPDANTPGISLFDYPDRTGYIDGTDGLGGTTKTRPTFTNTRPVPETKITFRFYWPQDWNWDNDYIWFTLVENRNSEVGDSYLTNGNFSGTPASGTANGWRYHDFTLTETQYESYKNRYARISFAQADNADTFIDKQLSEFKEGADGRRHLYVTQKGTGRWSTITGYPGIPAPRETHSYRIRINGNSYDMAEQMDGTLRYELSSNSSDVAFNIQHFLNNEVYEYVFAPDADPDITLGLAKQGVSTLSDNGSDFRLNPGVYTIVFDPDKLTVTVTGTEVTYTYAFRGNITDSDPNKWNDYEMTKQADGTYAVTVTSNYDSRLFGISKNIGTTQKAWFSADGTSNIPSEGGTFNIKENGTNFTLEKAGKYEIVFNEPAKTLTVTNVTPVVEYTYRLYGLLSSSEWSAISLDKQSDGTFTKTDVEVSYSGAEFGIQEMNGDKQNRWLTANWSITGTDSKTLQVISGTNIKIAQGTYDFVFNPKTSVLTVTKKATEQNPTQFETGDKVVITWPATSNGVNWTNIHYWGDSVDNTTWPGSAGTPSSDGTHRSATINITATGTSFQYIINNNDKQTDDLTLNFNTYKSFTKGSDGHYTFEYVIDSVSPK